MKMIKKVKRVAERVVKSFVNNKKVEKMIVKHFVITKQKQWD